MLGESKPADMRPFDRADLVARVKPSIVQIKTDAGLGSGFVVHESGLIVTNYHVIVDARTRLRGFQQWRIAANRGLRGHKPRKRPGDSPRQDTCKIEADSHTLLAPAQGESVIAFGSPQKLGFTVSEGIVSAVRTGRDVQEAVGDWYQEQGYDPNALWVQTTAPISPGNSGGPLIGMDGTVVGINTWERVDRGSQNLNFAAFSGAIADLMKHIAGLPVPLARLASPMPRPGPARIASSHPIQHPHYPSRVDLALPNGEKLTEAMLEIPRNWHYKLFPETAIVFVARYPNGAIQGVFTLSNAKLDGAAATLYERGHLQTLAFYDNGQLTGPLKQWNKDGEPSCTQNTITESATACSASSRTACLGSSNTGTKRTCKTNGSSPGPAAFHESRLSPDSMPTRTPKAASAVAKLCSIQEEIKRNEPVLKQKLRDWYHKEDQRIKQQRIAQGANDRYDRATRESAPVTPEKPPQCNPTGKAPSAAPRLIESGTTTTAIDRPRSFRQKHPFSPKIGPGADRPKSDRNSLVFPLEIVPRPVLG